MAANVHIDANLSTFFSKLWDLDVNRCQPGVDYDIDIQGYVTSTNLARPDRASENLFSMFAEDQVFARPTFRAFRVLLDNYESESGKEEEVTKQEEQENWQFINTIMDTSVMKETHRFLVAENRVPTSVGEFKNVLYDIWFKLYRRLYEDRVSNSSGFEHVFVGETRDHEVSGFHNWIQFYLQEKAGNVNYRGFFRRGTSEEMEKSPRLVTLQFTWGKGSGKPIGSSFIGTSPEFEIAVYTTLFLLHRVKVCVQIKQYVVELACHPHGRGIGTAYPVSKSD